MKGLNLRSYNYPYRERFPAHNLFKKLNYPLVKEWQHKFKSKKYNRWYSHKIKFKKLPAGAYLVEASQGRQVTQTPLIISDLALMIKEGGSSRFIYGYNLKEQKPVESAKVTIFQNNYSKKEKNY